MYMCEELREAVKPVNSVNGLPVHIKVLTSIRVLVDGSYQRGTGQDHEMAVAQTTVSKYLTQVTGAIVRILMPKWISFPGVGQTRQNVGRVHDQFIFNNSKVKLEMKRLYDNKIGQYYLLGDLGHALEPWLMTPDLEAAPNSSAAKYTQWHCQIIIIIEIHHETAPGLGVSRQMTPANMDDGIQNNVQRAAAWRSPGRVCSWRWTRTPSQARGAARSPSSPHIHHLHQLAWCRQGLRRPSNRHPPLVEYGACDGPSK
ncbi:unnamed protein product [Parnassius apollo]|uniref:(apollo) hypothetical protein n=1 Tax=Parnassius apollo TaxID=110799 RepID=A0A8S3XIG2_PARAO|nr:unnamed protein product [Parnassius apollo]